jgi:hypothetical protein
MTSLSARITLDKNERSSLHTEWASTEASDTAPKEPLETPLDPPTCDRVLKTPWHDSCPPTRALRHGEKPARTVEDLFAVGSPDHEPEEVLDLPIREANSLLNILLVGTDLSVDYIAQAQTARHRLGRIFCI